MFAWVGRTRDRELDRLVTRFIERSRRLAPLRVREVRAARNGEVERRQREESAALEEAARGAESVLLTVRGEEWSSERLASYVEQRLSASSATVFCVGGELGFRPQDEGWADRRLAVSAMTLPHEIARLVLAEQVYRSLTIARNIKYHK